MEENKETPVHSSAPTRQLAAVMFADMMGYTALMQEDEKVARRQKDRMCDVLERHIPVYHGRIIQNYGDGTLTIFGSATEAVHCAIAIQLELQKDPVIPVRIGIHSGDVYFDEHNVYGDSVNLASRIESLAVPGAVLISDKMYDEIKNQRDILPVSMGSYNLKNIKRLVEIYAIANEGLVIPSAAHVGFKAGTAKSIAVLPFVNMSSDPDNEYFSDGIAEEILNALTRVEGLQVCSRSSSFTFKGKNKDARQIGSELGVSTLLEGSVRKAGNKVRITAQLINTADGYHAWSEVYDGDLDDIFRVQDEISRKIVERLRENFNQQGKHDPLVKPHTGNLEAYNVYLKGRFHWNKSNPEEIKKAMSDFEACLLLDPTFTEAHCMLSFCYSFLGSSGHLPREEAYSKAKDHTIRAIESDPRHAESHLALAAIKFFQNWDFKGAEDSIQKAISLGLNSSLLHQLHGMTLIAKGHFEEAIEKMKTALIQDPLSLQLMSYYADALAFAGRFEEAMLQYDRILELDPNFRKAYEGKGYVYIALKQFDRAIENLEKYHSLVGHPLKGLSGLAHAYAASGQKDKADACIAKVRQRQEEEPNFNFDLDFAFIYSGFQDLDKVFYHLDRTYEARMGIACTGIIFCLRYPMITQDLKSDDRYQQLLQKIGME